MWLLDSCGRCNVSYGMHTSSYGNIKSFLVSYVNLILKNNKVDYHPIQLGRGVNNALHSIGNMWRLTLLARTCLKNKTWKIMAVVIYS